MESEVFSSKKSYNLSSLYISKRYLYIDTFYNNLWQ